MYPFQLAAVPRVKKWLDAAQDVQQQHIELLKEENERKLPEVGVYENGS